MKLSDFKVAGYKGSIAARFWSKVDKSGDCWEWQAAKDYEIRTLYVPRVVTQEALALKYGVCRATIGLIVTRKNWKGVDDLSELEQ
jgi:hypothetical protein